MSDRLKETVLLITGMRDNRCREALAEALAKLDGVSRVDVSLHRARATVVRRSTCNPVIVVDAVAAAGYAAQILSDRDHEPPDTTEFDAGASPRPRTG